MSEKTTKKAVVTPPSALYRRIAFSFIAAAIVLLGVVSYYSITRVTIIVTPHREALRAPLSVDVSADPDEYSVQGAVGVLVVEAARTFPVSDGEGTTQEVPATGVVTIKNTTGKSQPLIRTTRLLTPSGQLFRLAETVDVPAGGSVTANVYADDPGSVGEIGPSQFTIPGLWEGIQDKIYAESTEAFCCGTNIFRTLSDADLKAAAQELEVTLLEEARNALIIELEASTFQGEMLLPEILERSSDTEPGAEATEFTVGLTLKVTGVFYDEAAVYARAQKVLDGLAGPHEALVEVDPDRMSITVERHDLDLGTARLAVDAVGLLALRPESTILRKERLVGLDRAALESYFDAWQSVESVRIEFRPSWLRRVPRLLDHIEIQIAE